MIEKHTYKTMLMDRLVEELIDMADTCSTGHCNRLVNVFSGIDGFVMDIGWRNQIESNIAGRLTTRARIAIDHDARHGAILLSAQQIKDIDDEYRAKILCEMLSEHVDERLTFNQFFREVIGDVRNELREEFVTIGGYISADDFDIYFRQGLVFYETGERDT